MSEEALVSSRNAHTVFVSDPSVEAERISQALRDGGFHVVDVPLAMLVARVAVQKPNVIIIDCDADGALDAIGRMRELPASDSIDVLFCGRAGDALSNASDAHAHEGSGFFSRPVNVADLLKKTIALTVGSTPGNLAEGPSSHPPAPSKPPADVTLKRLSQPPPAAPPSKDPTRLMHGPLSSELENLLVEAEARIGTQLQHDSTPPSPDEEIEAVLPEEILAALDEPLEAMEEEEESSYLESSHRQTTSGGSAKTTGQRRAEVTNDGATQSPKTHGDDPFTPSASPSQEVSTNRESHPAAPQAFGAPSFPATRENPAIVMPVQMQQPAPPAFGVVSLPTAPPPRPKPSSMSSTLGSEVLIQAGGMLVPVDENVTDDGIGTNAPKTGAPDPPTPQPPPAAAPPMRDGSVRAASVPAPAVAVLHGVTDAGRALARAIAARASGAVAIESQDGIRRVVLREGDITTAASGVETESLLAFLSARGDLPRDVSQQLSGRIPPYGRHAGAALVAQGALGQDQLWPILRAHAEWLIGQALAVQNGTAALEPEPPGRLRTEPTVFGGATGADVFVEVVRRIVDNDLAVQRMGGGASRIGDGQQATLLRECNLGAAELEAIERSKGASLEGTLSLYAETDIASVLYALWLLGVVDVMRSVGAPDERADPGAVVALDEEALRSRIRARLQLVDEGDYFAVLGVARTATGYEVKRAFLDLRRTFDPSRILTPRLADLADDVRKIAIVLEEAYEILGDSARRERYKRAIEEAPQE